MTRLLTALLCLALYFWLPAPSQAQNTNPAPANCGLPKAGDIFTTVTYTLTADCTQTDGLHTAGDFPANGKVTIDGGGYTIDASALDNSSPFFQCGGSTSRYEIEIKDVTIKGGGKQSSGAVYLWACDATLTRVTFTESVSAAIFAYYENRTWTLNDILVENLKGVYWGYSSYGALIFSSSPTVNFTNIVFRDVFPTAAAIIHSPSYAGTPSITIDGCLTVERVYAQFTNATITDNSTGKCTGTIGNGGSAVLPNPAPTVSACGLPLAGHLQTSAQFVLTANCQLTGPLYIPKGLTVGINGNGHTIRSASGKIGISSAGTTTIQNAILDGGSRPNLLAHLKSNLTVRQTTFRNQQRPLQLFDATILFDKVIFEDNDVGTYGFGSAMQVLKSATVTIRDSMIRDSSGGNGAVYLGFWHWDGSARTYPSVTLEGCTSFENNSPADTIIRSGTEGTLTDNRNNDPFPCQPQIGAPPKSRIVLAPDAERSDGAASARSAASSAFRDPDLRDGFALGAFANVYRHSQDGQPGISIWGIDRETSQGFHLVTVWQAQLDALQGAGLAAAAADCRAQVLRDELGNVIIKAGPNYQGKTLHAVLQGSLAGAVISQYTTYDDPICPPVTPTPSTLDGCMVNTLNILNMRETPGGTVLRILPYAVTLTAFQRVGDWVEVDFYGLRGWISAKHVTFVGSC